MMPGAPYQMEPGERAQFDQMGAAADQQLDGEVAYMRSLIDQAGPEVATAAMVVDLLERADHRSLSMAYAWALRRLAQLPAGDGS